MKQISLYADRNSFVHDLDPISKLYYILFSILIPVVHPSITVSVICAILSVLLLLLAKVFKKALPVFLLVFIVLITVVIIQGLFRPGNETVFFKIGPAVFYKEGLLYALKVTLRVTDIVGAFLILVLTTKPSDLVESLVRKGLSPKIGYVVISVFQIIPEMISTMSTIMDAQRARGLETEGNIITRIKAFIPLLGPVVLGSLVNTKERAMALEVRGFNAQGKKTFLNEEKTSVLSKPIQWGLLLIVVMAIVWRLLA